MTVNRAWHSPTALIQDPAPFENGAEAQWQRWLTAVGLRFDPFVPLEASADPHLGHYFVVAPETFAVAWGEWPALVFGPPGGGKTALKAQIAQACWIGQETNRPFPIPYNLPFLSWAGGIPSQEQHLLALTRAAAQQLLLMLAHRPHWLFRCRAAEQRAVRAVLNHNLPGPLDSFLEPCREAQSLAPLREMFPPAFVPRDPPDAPTLARFCQTLTDLPETPRAPLTAAARWEEMLTVLLEVLKFPSVYLLVDGIDGAIETARAPELGVACLAPLWPCLPKWAERRVYLKAFAPAEAEPPLWGSWPSGQPRPQTAHLEWSPAQLATIIRQRLYFASDGAFGSLAAIAARTLPELELVLANAIQPIPREMLVLTRQLLALVAQKGIQQVKIWPGEMEQALLWYAAQRSPTR